MHYHDTEDMRLLRDVRRAAPREFAAALALDKIVDFEDGSIPRKYRELIAIACTVLTQCVYCIEAHAQAARRSGASREEIAEASLIAAALSAGAAMSHSALAIKHFIAADEDANRSDKSDEDAPS